MNFLKAGFDEAKWNTFSKNRLSNDIIQLPHRRSVNRIDKLCNSSSVRDVRRLPYRDLTIGILLFSLGILNFCDVFPVYNFGTGYVG